MTGAMHHFLLAFIAALRRSVPALPLMSMLLIIPIGLIGLNSAIGDPIIVDGYNLGASFNLPAFVLSFQFFNMAIVMSYLYEDFRSDRRWRLRATPHSLMSFVIPTFMAGWFISILFGLVTTIVAAIAFNAYLGNLLVFASVFLLISLMATLVGMLLFLLVKKFSAANTAVYIISFGLMILSGYMIPLGNSTLAEFLQTSGTPLALGTRAIGYSGKFNDFDPAIFAGSGMDQALINIAILAAITAVLALAAFVIAKRKGV